MRPVRIVPVALIGAALLAPPVLAAAKGPIRGVRVPGSRPVFRTTAALSEPDLVRAPRIQPTEHEETPPDKVPGPYEGTIKPDGGPRVRGPNSLTFPDDALTFDGPGNLANDVDGYPPDTVGDVGPTQFVGMINGRVRSYSKATGLPDDQLNAKTDVFFAPVMTPGAVGNFTTDPRVRYDRLSGRWFLVMIDVPTGLTNRIMIAVSDGGTITTSTVWTLLSITAPSGEFADYETLGIDANALYIGTNQFNTAGTSGMGTDAYVIRKSALIAPTPSVVATRFDLVPSSGGAGLFTPQGVDNIDPTATVGYFIGVDNAVFNRLDIRRVSDPGGTPTLSADLNVTVPITRSPVAVPHPNQTKPLDPLDDRLFAASMRNGHIWTAHNVGVQSNGVTNATSAQNDRTGSRWYEIDVGGNSGTPSLVQSGTVFDSAASNPKSFWIPTIATNGQGMTALGGSVAGATTAPNAWYAGRRSTASPGTVDAPTTYTSGTADYNIGGGGTTWRWGDYSIVRVDPQDDQTLWVMQEYVLGTNQFGTKIVRLRGPGPATPVSASAPLARRRASTTVTITGTSSAGSAFFDPGSGFASRISAAVGCGATVNGVLFNSTTSVTLDLNTTNASQGDCPVTITNPDGQQASSATPILTLGFAPVSHNDSATATTGQTLNGGSVLANDTDADNDTLTAGSPSTPAHGSLTLHPDGTFAYTPDAGFTGTDSFTYIANDGTAQSAAATVTITVTEAPPATSGGGDTTTTPPPSDKPTNATPTETTPTTTPTNTTPTTPLVRCRVPVLRGLTLSAARTKLARAHCRLGTVTRKRSRTGRRGRIIAASRRPGTRLRANAKINVTVRRS